VPRPVSPFSAGGLRRLPHLQARRREKGTVGPDLDTLKELAAKANHGNVEAALHPRVEREAGRPTSAGLPRREAAHLRRQPLGEAD